MMYKTNVLDSEWSGIMIENKIHGISICKEFAIYCPDIAVPQPLDQSDLDLLSTNEHYRKFYSANDADFWTNLSRNSNHYLDTFKAFPNEGKKI